MSDRTLHLQWIERAAAATKNGELERWMRTELHSQAWESTLDVVARHARLSQATRVADVGFGWGRVVLGLAMRHPNVQFEGIELAPEFVEAARGLVDGAGLKNVSLQQGDVYQWRPEPGRYDAIVSTRVLHYLDDRPTALSRMFEALRPGGRLVAIVPNRWCPPQWVAYEHGLVDPLALASEARAAGFTGVSLRSARFLPRYVASRLRAGGPARVVERVLGGLPPTRWLGALLVLVAERP
jgi:trans-aconitate methyltransferase